MRRGSKCHRGVKEGGYWTALGHWLSVKPPSHTPPCTPPSFYHIYCAFPGLLTSATSSLKVFMFQSKEPEQRDQQFLHDYQQPSFTALRSSIKMPLSAITSQASEGLFALCPTFWEDLLNKFIIVPKWKMLRRLGLTFVPFRSFCVYIFLIDF